VGDLHDGVKRVKIKPEEKKNSPGGGYFLSWGEKSWVSFHGTKRRTREGRKGVKKKPTIICY